jgi:UDP-N-acetyl-D-glucosamine/UDP-N-acetyl-D-galactosamine dehydrogenase
MAFLQPLDAKIAVIGLGYVGLPLALALARQFPVCGYDSDATRVAELRDGKDRTGEISSAVLNSSNLNVSVDSGHMSDCNLFIVTVPTPIDASSRPDLSALRAASAEVGKRMKCGSVVVYESTVYPGVTEDVCGAELERASGLKCGTDFFLGYSPERINPGDAIHAVDKIVKVVAGQTSEVSTLLEKIYGTVVKVGVHVAPSIKTAEAAKVIENAQRDINIAFINEITMIFQRMGIDTEDVLEAARTKWNFLDFRPGLVGGHCIGVDPFYLAQAARDVGYEPEIILAGRRINDGMAKFVADEIHRRIPQPSRILVMGLTFKENVPDLRNSKVADMVGALRDRGHAVDVHDPIADPKEAHELCGAKLIANFADAGRYDAVVGAVAHEAYRQFTPTELMGLLGESGLLVDLKGIWRGIELEPKIQRWSL